MANLLKMMRELWSKTSLPLFIDKSRQMHLMKKCCSIGACRRIGTLLIIKSVSSYVPWWATVSNAQVRASTASAFRPIVKISDKRKRECLLVLKRCRRQVLVKSLKLSEKIILACCMIPKRIFVIARATMSIWTMCDIWMKFHRLPGLNYVTLRT